MDETIRTLISEDLTRQIQLIKDLEDQYMTGEECVRFCLDSYMRHSPACVTGENQEPMMVGNVMGSIISTLRDMEFLRAEFYELSLDTLKNIQKEEMLRKIESIQNECKDVKDQK